MRVTTGSFLKYTLLPGILPRAWAFVTSGFSCIPLYMAYIYKSVRLLPTGHPYLNPANTGKFGIRHVVFEARRHLEFKKENIDQIIIFFALLAAIMLLFMQFFMVFAALFAGPALAASNNYADFFGNPNPTYDIAFRLLDLTFGFGDPYFIFNSCAINNQPCQLAFPPGGGYVPVGNGLPYTLPTPFHTALHSLFHFYNVGILVVAFMISGYFIVTIVGETAQSGTPFGKRFNGMWAPTRLMVAIGLLTPLAYGMNGAQLMTLVIAKWGSGLATNGWSQFMDDLSYMPIQQGNLNPPAPESLVARPNAPTIDHVAEFVFAAQTCKHMERLVNRRGNGKGPAIAAYQVYGDQNMAFTAGSFNAALTNSRNSDIVIRFGVIDDQNFSNYTGHVKPICGEILFHTKGVDPLTQPGAFTMQAAYYDMVYNMWIDAGNDLRAQNVALRFTPTIDKRPNAQPIPTMDYVEQKLTQYNQFVVQAVDQARTAQVGATWTDDFTILGWAGAGIWYQKIAEYTGSLFSSIYATPTANLYPGVMEHVKNQRRTHNDFVDGAGRFRPSLSNGEDIEWANSREQNQSLAYYYGQQLWAASYEKPTGNTLKDTVISIFGLQGLFDMQNQVDVHPLAQLVGVGRSLIESAATNLGYSFAGGVFGGIANVMHRNLIGSVSAAAASFAGQIAMIGLSIGFILYYILPFLPFIYFFFAAGGWVKGIFEAMVGLPLWAIAHIRIDGEGLPGPAAINGYMLIFEILVRPILIVFGLLGGLAIFTAQVQILNEIWQLVTSNIMGFNPLTAANTGQVAANGTGAGVGAPLGSIEYLRGEVDKLFYTIMYAIMVYMMAMASFKMIDLVPNNILRWVGSSVVTFNEGRGDPAASLVQYSYMGSQMLVGQLNQGIQGIAARAAPKM